jgi:TRAP-type C4-dicarboxylate transport system permease small subunit
MRVRERVVTLAQRVGRLQEFVERWAARLSGIALGAIVLVVCADVLARRLLRSRVPGAYELTGLLMVPTVAFGLAWVQQLGDHIRVTFVVDLLGTTVKRLSSIAGNVMGLALFGVLTVALYRTAEASQARQEWSAGSVAIPIYPIKWALAAGVTLMTLRLLRDAIGQTLGPARKVHTAERAERGSPL